MKKLFIAISFVLLPALAAAQAPPPAPDTGSLAQELVAKSNAVHTLAKSKNINELKALLADDFEIVGSEGKLHGRGELLGDAAEGILRDFQLYDAKVVQIDSGTALVTYNLIVTMLEGDDFLAPRYQKISDLWVRQGSEWRLKFEQATPLRPID
jgi:hypothetical protein